jgi:sec-independent protein translocase protein TatA
MFGLSAGHLIVLGIIVLLFGSRKLPELGSSLGKGMRAFKSAVDGKLDDDDRPTAQALADKSSDEIRPGEKRQSS